ncbi:MAG: hypothetical protein EP333_09265 [Bacteroidetes bacterium]|nr:MAG: hypothetical protein EP333_09265 [Bacteroidota bacterium]
MKRSIPVILVLFVLSACGEEKKEHVTFTEFLKNTAKKTAESLKPKKVTLNELFDGDYPSSQTVEFEGIIGAIPTTITWSGGKMNVKIVERRNQTGGRQIGLEMPLGTENNHVHELPEEYQQSDLKVVTNDGTIVSVGDRVRIKAKGYYRSGDYCTLDVISIRSIANEFDESVFETAVPLTDAILNDTAQRSVYCYMDGSMSIPSVYFSMYGEIGLDFANKTNKQLKKVDVMVGDGPSTMNSLPNNYSARDLIIRDYKGEQIKYGNKVRVYGVWDRYSFKSSLDGPNGKFKLEEIKRL